MDGSESSLQNTMNVIEVFGSLSGLKMNSSKTKGILISQKKFCKEKLDCGNSLNWDSSNFSLLGITFDLNLSNIPQINYGNTMLKIEKKHRNLEEKILKPIRQNHS